MQVAKWGNSLAVRLPAAVVEALKLKEGDQRDSDRRCEDVRDPARPESPGRARQAAKVSSSSSRWVRLRPRRCQCPLVRSSIRTC